MCHLQSNGIVAKDQDNPTQNKTSFNQMFTTNQRLEKYIFNKNLVICLITIQMKPTV